MARVPVCFPASGPWPRTSLHVGGSLPSPPMCPGLAYTLSCLLGICPLPEQKLGDTVCTVSLLGSSECERGWGTAGRRRAPWSTLDGRVRLSAGSGSRLRGKQGLQRGQIWFQSQLSFPPARFEAQTPPPPTPLLPWEKLLLQSGQSPWPPPTPPGSMVTG